MKIVFNPRAFHELEAATAWYRNESKFLAQEFLSEIQHALDAIVAMPHAWPPHKDDIRRYVLRRFPFGVIYRQHSQTIRVTAVMHGKRQPFYWVDRV